MSKSMGDGRGEEGCLFLSLSDVSYQPMLQMSLASLELGYRAHEEVRRHATCAGAEVPSEEAVGFGRRGKLERFEAFMPFCRG
jgi:hypothetical protein